LRWLDRAFYRQESEPAFQTFEVPLRLFDAPGWPSRISEIRLVFDRAATGAIAITEIGFRQPFGGGD
jgi:hypothetical protein